MTLRLCDYDLTVSPTIYSRSVDCWDFTLENAVAVLPECVSVIDVRVSKPDGKDGRPKNPISNGLVIVLPVERSQERVYPASCYAYTPFVLVSCPCLSASVSCTAGPRSCRPCCKSSALHSRCAWCLRATAGRTSDPKTEVDTGRSAEHNCRLTAAAQTASPEAAGVVRSCPGNRKASWQGRLVALDFRGKSLLRGHHFPLSLGEGEGV
ncbi:hypothetical protein BJX63DRAFT_184809 [Aspergillus granulosus]|uniref:Uncharacterized protein n=1 Tax=Aspergillus granulosus TaxID=176169 RepID=A0ABR4HIG5_9EURO